MEASFFRHCPSRRGWVEANLRLSRAGPPGGPAARLAPRRSRLALAPGRPAQGAGLRTGAGLARGRGGVGTARRPGGGVRHPAGVPRGGMPSADGRTDGGRDASSGARVGVSRRFGPTSGGLRRRIWIQKNAPWQWWRTSPRERFGIGTSVGGRYIPFWGDGIPIWGMVKPSSEIGLGFLGFDFDRQLVVSLSSLVFLPCLQGRTNGGTNDAFLVGVRKKESPEDRGLSAQKWQRRAAGPRQSTGVKRCRMS